jgi:tRNA-Thr(GGU) m(6)t(6)A37 methyltransferase TsaA
MDYIIKPVAFVRNSRFDLTDDEWGTVISTIELAGGIEEDALMGIDAFSHLEIIYHFHKMSAEALPGVRHPRNNASYPLTGIFAQRNSSRPNGIGLCTVELIDHKGRELKVRYLDAVNGTPVIDIKPVYRQFEPQGAIVQPGWVDELTENYWC